VDDGSTDNSADVARAWGAHVVRTGRVPSGPACARTRGAAEARAPLLCFVDADVLVRPTTLDHFVNLFRADPDLVAAFGSYDAMPSAQACCPISKPAASLRASERAGESLYVLGRVRSHSTKRVSRGWRV